jgi:hypothetical protein
MNTVLHIWYMVISTLIIIGLLLLFRFAPCFQKERTKNLLLFFIALSSFLVHSSELLLAVPLGIIDFMSIDISNIAVISPCTASMWALLLVGITAVLGRGTAFFKWLAVGTAYIGFFGAVITVYVSVVMPDIDLFVNWFWTANVISHSLLLLGCLYLFTGRFIKIRVANTLCVAALGLCYAVIGGVDIFINTYVLKLDGLNPMYMQAPMRGIAPFNGWVILALAVAVTLIFAVLYELCFVKPEDRFYKNWRNKSYWTDQ